MKHTIWGTYPLNNNFIISIDGAVRKLPQLSNREQRSREGFVCNLTESSKGRLIFVCDRRIHQVSRAVAETHIKKPVQPWKTQVLHKDDKAKNNVVENLYWGDYEDNLRDSIINGKREYSVSESTRASTYRVTHISNGDKELKFKSRTEAAKYIGVHIGTLSTAITSKALIKGWRVW